MHFAGFDFQYLRDAGADQRRSRTQSGARRCYRVAPCHGLDGIGHDVDVPNIGGQHSVYLRQQLLAFKSGRRKHPEMYFIGRHLTDRDIDELVDYYSTLPTR